MKPLISVIICTRDRAESLRRALQSLCVCDVPDRLDWEVLVVDNGSTDDTSDVAKAYQGRLPMRLIHEPTAGLSQARNCGTEAAQGKWLVWIDDDVVVSTHWLCAYHDAAQQYPEAAVFGGVISPSLTGEPASWLLGGISHIHDAYAARIGAMAHGRIKPNAMPYGANFALAHSAATRHPFDIELGRHPQQPFRGGEELSVIRRILSEGGTGYWVHEAQVDHCIGPERQTEAYLNAYFHESGYAAAHEIPLGTPSSRMSMFLNSLLRWSAHRLDYAIHRADLTRTRRARNIRESAWHLGYLRGRLQKRKWSQSLRAHS